MRILMAVLVVLQMLAVAVQAEELDYRLEESCNRAGYSGVCCQCVNGVIHAAMDDEEQEYFLQLPRAWQSLKNAELANDINHIEAWTGYIEEAELALGRTWRTRIGLTIRDYCHESCPTDRLEEMDWYRYETLYP